MASYYTTVGKQLVVDRVDGTLPGSNIDYLATGTGATAASVASTGLSAEVAEARVACAKSQPTQDKNQWLATQTYTGPKTITNLGIFDNAVGGTLIVITDALSIAVDVGDAIQATVTLQQT